MGTYEKAYIYFDTNSLECRHSGKSLYLSQFIVNPIYYEIEDLIRNMGLTGKVEICIPDIVCFELREHLLKHFKAEKSSMETKIGAFRKSFGDLAEVICEFKDCRTEEEYSDYADGIIQDFLDSPRVNAKIISCPKDEESVKQIIQQAIHSARPFRTAKASGKEYTDAGFKDALVFYTILAHTGEQLGLFVSNDTDFSELFDERPTSNLRICSSAKDVQVILSKEFDVISIAIIEDLLKPDTYLMQRILSECDLEENCTVYGIKIASCETKDDNVDVQFTATVNGQKLTFDITYNINAKELLGASCEPYDEEAN